MYVDPKVKLIDADNEPTLSVAIDDKGNSLLPPANRPTQIYGNREGLVFEFSAPLKYPDDGYSQLSRIRGTLNVELAAKTQTMEIPDLAHAVHKSYPAGRWTVEVEDCQVDQHSGSFRLKIHTGGAPPQAVFNAERDLRLIDAAGKSISRNGGGGGGTDQDVEYSSSFAVSDSIKLPVTLQWGIVTETQSRAVPFEFSDLPLPTP